MIPKTKPGRLPKYDLKSIRVGKFIEVGKYDREKMIKIGSMLYYFNGQLKPMRFVQRKSVDGKILIYREN